MIMILCYFSSSFVLSFAVLHNLYQSGPVINKFAAMFSQNDTFSIFYVMSLFASCNCDAAKVI